MPGGRRSIWDSGGGAALSIGNPEGNFDASREDSVEVRLLSNGGPTDVKSIKAWEMMPSNSH